MASKLSLYIVLGLITLGLQLAFGGELSSLLLPGNKNDVGPLDDVLLGLGVGIGTVVLSRLGSIYLEWTRRLEEEFAHVLGPLTSLDILVLAAMSSFVEELFFRGFLQGHLGLLVTSLLFGLAHFPYRRQLIPWTIAAILMGFIFGWMVESQGSLLAPILAHFIVNYFNLHYIVRPRPAHLT